MRKLSTKTTRLPGGRHLTTLEIVCGCTIVLVGYLILRHVPSEEMDRSEEGAGLDFAPGETVVLPSVPQVRGVFRPSAGEPVGFEPTGVSNTHSGEDFSAPSPEVRAAAIADFVAEHDDVVSAVETEEGVVRIVYTDGSEDKVTFDPARASVEKSGPLFRSPMNDLKSKALKIDDTEGMDAAERSAQLATFKRLATDGQGETREARKALENLVPEEMPMAIDVLDQMGWNEETRGLMQNVMAKWGETDPMGALAHAEGYESLRQRNEALGTVLSSFARNDPEGALKWYFDNLETDPRTRNLSPASVFRELAEQDFAGALQRVNQIEDKQIRQSSLRSMLATVDSDQRFAAIDNMYAQAQNLEDKSMFAQEYVAGKSRYYPYEAAEWIAQIDQPDVQAKAIDTLITTWSADRPDQAAEWVMRLADDDLRQKQLTNISRNWSRFDPEVAEGWLDSFPPNPDMDGAVSGHISTLRKTDPAQASAWVEKIHDPAKRLSTVRSIAKDWVKTDPVGARDYILQAEMDDKNRVKYLNLANQAIAIQQQFDQLN